MFSLKGILGENIATLLHLKSCLRMLEVAIINLNFLWVQGSKKNMYSKKIEIKHTNQIPCQHGQPTVPTIVKPETNKTVQRIKLPKMSWYAFFEGLFIKHTAQILTHKKIFAKLTTIHVPCQPFIFLFQTSATYSILPVLLPVFPATALHRHPSTGKPPEKRCPHSPAPGQKEPSQMPSQRPRRSRQTAATPKWNEAICRGLGGFRSDPAGEERDKNS